MWSFSSAFVEYFQVVLGIVLGDNEDKVGLFRSASGEQSEDQAPKKQAKDHGVALP